jgi:hypothetical protein
MQYGSYFYFINILVKVVPPADTTDRFVKYKPSLFKIPFIPSHKSLGFVELLIGTMAAICSVILVIKYFLGSTFKDC